MTKSILVGVDGSDYSRKAIEVAVKMAKVSGACLYGIGIVDTPTIFRGSPGSLAGFKLKEKADQAQYKKAKKEVRAFLAEFQDTCVNENICGRVLQEEGSPLEEILREAIGFDVIMLGQKVYFEFEGEEGPSNILTHLLKDTPRPVFVVPKEVRYSYEKPALMALDGSVPSYKALQLYVLLCQDNIRDIHLITIDDDRKHAEAIQNRARDYCNQYNMRIHQVVRKGKAGPEILDYARDIDAGRIILGAYGVTGLKKLFFGSLTTRMLKKSDRLLFLYH